MNRFFLLAFLLLLAIDFGNASSIALVSQPYFIPGQRLAQTDILADSFELPSSSIEESNLVRRKRAFNTYNSFCAFCAFGPVFNFGKKYTAR